MNREELTSKYHLNDCTRCENECAESCPVFHFYRDYNPGQLAGLFLEEREEELSGHPLLWSCVTCRRCTHACPYDVEFGDFIKNLRRGREGYRPLYHGLIHRWQQLQTDAAPGSKPARMEWTEGFDINGESTIALFAGCIPMYEEVFGEGDFHPLDTARSSLLLLNALGISPRILEDERCCGLDMYNLGRRDIFTRLARHNIDIMNKAGVDTVITVCPECAYALNNIYPEEFGSLSFRAVTIIEYIASRLDELDIRPAGRKLAFHDPCYLGRYRGIYSPPRDILDALSVNPPVSLEHEREDAPCCGAGSWNDHGRHTRCLVNERLVEADRCGADTLVTGCPRCEILFNEVNPAGSWKQSPVEVVDLLNLLAASLSGGGSRTMSGTASGEVSEPEGGTGGNYNRGGGGGE